MGAADAGGQRRRRALYTMVVSWPSGASSRPPAEATALALGIHEDTGSLTYPSTTLRDVEALAFCARHGADSG